MAGLRQMALMIRAKAANRFSATGGLFTNSELSGAKGDRATAGRAWSTQRAKQKVESRKQKWGEGGGDHRPQTTDLRPGGEGGKRVIGCPKSMVCRKYW